MLIDAMSVGKEERNEVELVLLREYSPKAYTTLSAL